MNTNKQLVSVQVTIRNIISKLGLRGVEELPYGDIVIWCGEAISHIGSYQSLERVSKKVQVTSYIGQWPRDLYEPWRVVGHPRYLPKRGGFQIDLQDGEVEVEYTRIPSDDEGLPMFPGDPSTQEAILWYCAKWLSIQGLLRNPQLTVDYCNSRWQRYCGQARAEGYAPDMPQWERMMDNFRKWLPERYEYDRDFIGLNVSEDISFDQKNDPRITNHLNYRG